MKRQLLMFAILFLSASVFAQVAPATGEEKEPAAQPTPKKPRFGDVDVQRAMADREKAQAERAAAEANLVYTRNAFANWKQKSEKGSYLGIATSSIPTVLRDQLKLDKGVGLVVDRVDADSPAEAAGIKISDVIQKLDDQLLINPNQFGVLVRTLKPDVEVKLTLIRETKPQTVAIKPVEKDLTPLDEPIAGYGAAKQPWPEATTKWTGGNGRFTVTAPGGAGDMVQAEVFTMKNDNMTVTTTVGAKGEKHLTAIDRATGKIIYDDVVDETKIKELPAEVAEQVKAMKDLTFNRPVRVIKGNNLMGGGAGINFVRPANNLPRVKAVSGSDDDYTWDLTTKTNENGKPELDLLLLDKNGNKLFDGPFSRTKNMKELPAQVSERLGSYPWDLMIEDLKNAGGGPNAVLNLAAPPAPAIGPATPQPPPAKAR